MKNEREPPDTARSYAPIDNVPYIGAMRLCIVRGPIERANIRCAFAAGTHTV